MPSNQKAIDAILSLIPRDFQGKIYDLGAGFGTLAKAIASHCPHAQVIGFEISPIPYICSNLFFKRVNLVFRRRNFLKEDLSRADLVVCYLFPKGMQHLEQREWKELISNTFAFRNLKPTQKLEVKDLHRSTIYQYMR